MSKSKQSSSQAAWALLTQGVTSARVDAHQLRHMVNRGLAVVEASPHKEQVYQVAGDLLTSVPSRLEALEVNLDRTSLALARMGEDFLKVRLPLSDRVLVDDAISPTTFTKGSKELAAAYLASIKMTPNQMSGYSTFTTERSTKGLPQVTNLPSSDSDAYPHSSLPQPSEYPGKDRTLKVPQPGFQTPSPVQSHGSDEPASSERGAGMSMMLDPEAPTYTRPRTMPQEGEERGHPVMEQGSRLHIRRPEVLAGGEEGDEKAAAPYQKVPPSTRQRKQRGPSKAKSQRYERARGNQGDRRTYLKQYRRQHKNRIDKYNAWYHKNPGARSRKAASDQDIVQHLAQEFLATFQRDEEAPVPRGRHQQEVGVPLSETGPTPFSQVLRNEPRSDGSAKVTPPHIDRGRSWKQ